MEKFNNNEPSHNKNQLWDHDNDLLQSLQLPYFSFDDLLNMIEEPNKSACLKLYQDYKNIIDNAPWSKVKHQAWEWWYKAHLTDIMNIASVLYHMFDAKRKYPFSLSDALLVLFLHDLEKPFKYAWDENQKNELKSFDNYQDFIIKKVQQYWIELSDNHLNGLKYVHGEWHDYDPHIRIQSPLAAFVHICDTRSARIWFDDPKTNNR